MCDAVGKAQVERLMRDASEGLRRRILRMILGSMLGRLLGRGSMACGEFVVGPHEELRRAGNSMSRRDLRKDGLWC